MKEYVCILLYFLQCKLNANIELNLNLLTTSIALAIPVTMLICAPKH